jgi:hypothetical protein
MEWQLTDTEKGGRSVFQGADTSLLIYLLICPLIYLLIGPLIYPLICLPTYWQ